MGNLDNEGKQSYICVVQKGVINVLHENEKKKSHIHVHVHGIQWKTKTKH